jgi:hypothetical protein
LTRLRRQPNRAIGDENVNHGAGQPAHPLTPFRKGTSGIGSNGFVADSMPAQQRVSANPPAAVQVQVGIGTSAALLQVPSILDVPLRLAAILLRVALVLSALGVALLVGGAAVYLVRACLMFSILVDVPAGLALL